MQHWGEPKTVYSIIIFAPTQPRLRDVPRDHISTLKKPANIGISIIRSESSEAYENAS